MSILRLAYQYAAVLAVVTSCKPAEAQQKPKPVEAQQKTTLSSLTANGFEIKGTLSLSSIYMILVQKDKDAFACNIFPSKDGSYTSACFPIR
jgi:hypothetical protein